MKMNKNMAVFAASLFLTAPCLIASEFRVLKPIKQTVETTLQVRALNKLQYLYKSARLMTLALERTPNPSEEMVQRYFDSIQELREAWVDLYDYITTENKGKLAIMRRLAHIEKLLNASYARQ